MYFIDCAITVVPIFSHLPLLFSTAGPSSNPPLSSCPWVMHVSSFVTPFPILLLTSPYLFCTTNLCLILPPFPPFSPFPISSDNPPNDLYTYDSYPVLVVCFVF